MQFNQTNKNIGDVNNAISEKGNAVQITGSNAIGDVSVAASKQGNIGQAVGSDSRLQLAPSRDSFWTTVWKKINAIWKWFSA